MQSLQQSSSAAFSDQPPKHLCLKPEKATMGQLQIHDFKKMCFFFLRKLVINRKKNYKHKEYDSLIDNPAAQAVDADPARCKSTNWQYSPLQ